MSHAWAAQATHSLGMLSSRFRRVAMISVAVVGLSRPGVSGGGGARAGEPMMLRQTVKARDTSCRMNAAVASAWPCPRSARRASSRSCAVSCRPRVSSRITASCSPSDDPDEMPPPLAASRDCACMVVVACDRAEPPSSSSSCVSARARAVRSGVRVSFVCLYERIG